MKPKIVFVSHGGYAGELCKTANMIVGDIPGLYTIGMLMEDGMEGMRKKLQDLLDTFEADEPLLIVADILGGTPCNVAVEMMYQRENTRVMTGMSLIMAIEYAISPMEEVDQLCEALKKSGVEVVQILEKLSAEDEDGYED